MIEKYLAVLMALLPFICLFANMFKCRYYEEECDNVEENNEPTK